MGYIQCSDHGGKIILFVSKYHTNKVYAKEKCHKSEIIRVDVIDSFLLIKLKIKDQKINFQVDPEKCGEFFEALEAVCPICLKNYLQQY